MEVLPLSSALLASAEFDEEAGELRVRFKSDGSRWAYGNGGKPFTREDWDAFRMAQSSGRHFLENIRDEYPARRV